MWMGQNILDQVPNEDSLRGLSPSGNPPGLAFSGLVTEFIPSTIQQQAPVLQFVKWLANVRPVSDHCTLPCTIQYSTVQYSTALYNTVQHCTIQYVDISSFINFAHSSFSFNCSSVERSPIIYMIGDYMIFTLL